MEAEASIFLLRIKNFRDILISSTNKTLWRWPSDFFNHRLLCFIPRFNKAQEMKRQVSCYNERRTAYERN